VHRSRREAFTIRRSRWGFVAVLFAVSPAHADVGAEGPSLAIADDAAADVPPAAVSGLYPLWEDTGVILGHREAQVGWAFAGVGLLDRAQVGARLSSFVVRVPNLGVKVSLLRRPWLDVAARAAAFVYLPGATSSFTSENYSPAWENRDFTVVAAPLSLVTTVRPAPWFAIHHTATALATIAGGPVDDGVTVGNYVSAEVSGWRRHAFALHGGELGLWDHEQWLFGASYRLSLGWFRASCGYVYRKSDGGVQGQPLIDVGVSL
jgi:hypothetical protein